MNILIIGNGAREHVFFKLLSDSAVTANLFSINPNAAIQKLSSPIFKPFSFNLVKEIIKSSAIEMVIVGPEIPLIDGVYDFIKRSSVIHCTADGSKTIAGVASTLAHSESLTAHARSAEYRRDA